MGESSGKLRKLYVDRPLHKSRICLFHDPGHSSDKYKVLGDFDAKYS